MAEEKNEIKKGYYAYPEAKEGPKTDYKFIVIPNPVLRGWPLAIVGSLSVPSSENP